jgi:hypothetical protein
MSVDTDAGPLQVLGAIFSALTLLSLQEWHISLLGGPMR